ncbi:hypothetical protein CPS_2234 [Colwellia psychrerythraea 34H]|uniref:Uncharacterized protein n=1 Tax=Colwellia psychrerythraea (strain 34H / ATCC BAA-681) TaxID=167879 RepID=Q482Q8_COLP3|nr:hypothetical protein CPS_2234 [Colwellia psychrerythraea 34H]
MIGTTMQGMHKSFIIFYFLCFILKGSKIEVFKPCHVASSCRVTEWLFRS